MLSSSGVDTPSLLVHLAGVELTPEGRAWLQENLAPAQTVWLKLISREDGVLHCLVHRSGVRRRTTETPQLNVSTVFLKFYAFRAFPRFSSRDQRGAAV